MHLNIFIHIKQTWKNSYVPEENSLQISPTSSGCSKLLNCFKQTQIWLNSEQISSRFVLLG